MYIYVVNSYYINLKGGIPMSRKLLTSFLLVMMTFFLAGCGEFNLFSWAHKGGSNSDTKSLIADGQAALNDKDYADALTYFNEVLAADPDNSEALYGSAWATMGTSGLGLADIISSVIKDTSIATGSPAPPLQGEFASLFANRSTGSELESLLPSTLDLTTLYATVTTVVAKLKIIADGRGDGSIPANDMDVNINLTVCLILKAVCGILDTNADGTPGGTGDDIEVHSDFTVTLPDTDTFTYTESQAQALRDHVQSGINDISGNAAALYRGARSYIRVIVSVLNPKSGSALDDLDDNFAELDAEIQSKLITEINSYLASDWPAVDALVYDPYNL